MTTKKDQIYASQLDKVQDFVFDAKVADVFEDMINRSVPGYTAIYKMLPIIASRYIQAATNVYDLGCSLGEATLTIADLELKEDVKIIAVDNSQAMIYKLKKRLLENELTTPVKTICKDISQLEMKKASFVILNYTLQFIGPEKRDEIIDNIYSGMVEGGALLLSEKIKYQDKEQEEDMRRQHEEFKRNNDYSDLEISQKRESLENVLIRDTHEEHLQRLSKAGFKKTTILAEYLNFTSYIAVK